MNAPKPSLESISIQDKIIELLPSDETEALWMLANVVEACLHAIDEPMSKFIDRVQAYEDVRP